MFRSNFFGAVVFMLISGAMPSFAQTANTEVFGNAQVLELHQLGLSDAAVIAKIKAMNGKYDTSIGALKALKVAHVSNEIITAMLETQQQKPAAPVTPNAAYMRPSDPDDPMNQYTSGGVYIKGDGGKLTRLETAKGTVKGPSNAMLFIPFAGLAAKVKYYFNDLEPMVLKSRRPDITFYFASKTGTPRFSGQPVGNMVIVELEREDGRLMLTDRRLTSKMTRIKLEKVYKDIVYRAVPPADLPDGDYAIGNYDFDNAHSVASLAKASFLTELYPFTIKGGEVKK